MNKRSLRWGCLLASLFIVVLLVIGGGWWFLRPQDGTMEAPSSPVQVFLLSPAGGDEFSVGDYLQVRAQAFAPQAIVRAELFVDGKSLGAVTDSPESASWTWQAWPAGIHTLLVQAAAADGQVGLSQTVILTVLEGSGVIQSLAKEGQTLEQIGVGFGVPPDAMTNANPHLDPTQPLTDGQPVQVPTGGGAGSENPGSGGGPAGASIPDLIHWQFQATEPVDKSYCYTSFGDGIWYKMPKAPFDFFSGAKANYPQYNFPLKEGKGIIQAQCWGWLGGTLKYLGEGEAQFNVQQLPDQLVLLGSGFKLTGIPPVKTLSETGLVPPYALREPSTKEECYQNHGIAAGFLCAFLDPPAPQVKDKYVLVWEWQPPVCWPGPTCITKIDGYRVYEIETDKSVKLLKTINSSAQKVAAVPMGWAGTCFGVRAYINDPAKESEMVTWCGEKPTPKVMTLTPTDWLTTGGQWIQDGDCDTYGGADSYSVINQKSGFGNQPGEVLVGGYIVDDDDEDCFRQGDYSGGVKFKLPPALPPGAFIQKVVLKLSEVFTDYKVSGLATNIQPVCWSGVGKAEQDWTGLGDEKHFVGKNILMGYVYGGPFASLSEWNNNAPQVDVTSIVNNWIKHPDQNYGFIFYPAPVEGPYGNGSSTCYTGVGNVQLEIHYFAP